MPKDYSQIPDQKTLPPGGPEEAMHTLSLEKISPKTEETASKQLELSQEKRVAKERRHQLWKRVLAVLKALVLLGLVAGIPIYVYVCHYDLLMEMKDLDSLRNLLTQWQMETTLILFLGQIVQIVISVIPGQMLQMVAGFMYSILPAYLLSIGGAAVGSIITYCLGRFLGRDFMHILLGEEKIDRYIHRINSKRGVTIVFLLYLIPGFPKDTINYIAGVSEMKPEMFLAISLAGRTPGMLISIAIGRMLCLESYVGAVVYCLVAVVLFALGILYRKRLMAWFDRAYDRMLETPDFPELKDKITHHQEKRREE